MAPACTRSAVLTGAAAQVVEVRADIADGLAFMTLVGLPGTARDRIRAAIINSGEVWPQRAITAGLYPARLYSSAFDTAVAVAVLAAAGTVPASTLGTMMLFAVLGLDGRLRPMPGVQAAVTAAREAGFGAVVAAAGDAAGAALMPGIRVIPAAGLAQLATWLREPGKTASLPRHAQDSRS
jgi:magnesium chelatase family protein